MKNLPVRYFKYDYEAIEGVEIVECNRHEFEDIVRDGGTITYERNTVFENGVDQICLTVEGKEC
jgi:hypothetical protein